MARKPPVLRRFLVRRSVCETHGPTGEPGAGNPHAGFGEQGVETDLWEAGLSAAAKACGYRTVPYGHRATS